MAEALHMVMPLEEYEACGHDVEKEYYVNDAGRQIDILTAVFV